MKWLVEKRIIAGGFGLAILIFGAVNINSYQNTTQLFERQKRVEQTYEVLQEIKDVLTTLRDAERARRGYIITGKEFYLGTYNKAIQEINTKFDLVRHSTADNPNHQYKLDLIKPLIDERVALIQKSVELYKQNPSDRETQIELTDEGIALHDRISQVFSEMEAEEKLLLQRRTADSEASFRNTVLMKIVGFGISFGLLLAVYLLLHRQIRKRQQAEEIWRESEQRYRNLFEFHPHPLWVYDQETLACLAVNEAAIKHYGYSQAEFLAMTIKDIYLDSDVQKLTWSAKLAGVWQHQKRDGTVIDVEISSHELAFAGRQARLMLALNITEEKQAQEAIKVSEEKFRQIAENIHEVFWMMDTNLNHLLYVNPAYEKIWGRDCESLYANPKSFLDGVHLEDKARVMENIAENLTKEYEIEYRIVRPDGAIRWISDRCFPIQNSAGEVYRRIGVVRDITERKRAEEIRRNLEKERELGELKLRFFSMASHEFRTPLSTILISAQLLENSSPNWTPEKKLKNLHRIQSAAKTMTQLLTDILTLTRAESGKLEFKPERLDLDKFCRDLVEEVELSSRAQQNIFFISHCPGKNGYLDEKLLRSILSNLLSNAVKYSREDSHIYFTLDCESDKVIFEFQDQGIGIPSEDQENLFESFHRGQNVGDVPGTGLGLAVVKKCVDLHGGSITVQSKVGVGTTFTVTLPFKNCPVLTGVI
ncbi:PAS domain S-box protein [Microseira sp. BLCC-F43]|jgi:PAS domain S-box-containing protein|uniref:PAS domain S-box protein n=1 Tax=Microseira sp. BLCC-F43 TaxID=3153602 RepID=UPI0035B89A84